MTNPIALYGLTAVPASAETLLNATPIYPRVNATPDAILVADTPIPTTKLAQRIDEYALHHLPEPVYNHSRRVYHYGLAIKHHRFPFPDWDFSDETYFLACMLHDIGTAAEHQDTQLSFEFFGGFLALELLQDQKEAGGSAPRAQAESVAEAIIRHQDLTSVGSITAVGQLLQLATIFDNTGSYADLVHPETIKDMSMHFPRFQWSPCFASIIRRETDLKPWAHSTVLEDFAAKVLGNTLMEPYE